MPVRWQHAQEADGGGGAAPAGRIEADELRAAQAREGGVAGAVQALRVSEHGLRLCMTQLGIG